MYSTFARFGLACALCAVLYTSVALAAPAAADAPPLVTVTVPSSVGDGTAFLCTVRGNNLQSVTVTFLKRTGTATAKPGPDGSREATLLLPVPLDHKSAVESLSWRATLMDGTTRTGTTPVTVASKTYPVQRLTLAPKYVTPDPALKERIDRERKLMSRALNTYSAEHRWNVPMLRPVPGSISSWYGLRRVLNGEPRGAHRGLDFRAAAGDPIACIADGTVVLTGDFYYSGKFAVIDHGLGVLSTYMHMSEVLVRDGQSLATGDTIGRIGSTGRSTGPHLHLSLTILGESVDALPLLAMTARDKAAYTKAFSDAAKEGTTKPAAKAARKKTPAKTEKKSAPRKAQPTAEKTAKSQPATQTARSTQ